MIWERYTGCREFRARWAACSARFECGEVRASVLPTVVAIALVLLTAMLGLVMLWEQQTQLFVRGQRVRQARADVESAYTLYRLDPGEPALRAAGGFLLFDSLPQSRVRMRREPWGLYEAVHAASADSLVVTCRLMGAEEPPAATLFYADHGTALTLAGACVAQGRLLLPQNGIAYGRMGSDFYRGALIPQQAIGRSEAMLPQPSPSLLGRLDSLFALAMRAVPTDDLPDSLAVLFRNGTAAVFRLGDARIGNCTLRGRIVLLGGELRIDSTCRLEHPLVVARKITVGSGARFAAQLFARDTVVVEPRAVLEYPSGIWAGRYAGVGEQVRIDGYAIVRDTVRRRKPSPAYRQSRTARLRGLLWVEGTAEVQGIVAGRAVLDRAAYFSPQGYYRDLLYETTLLENAATVQPLWIAEKACRKEVVCVD